MGCCDSKQKVEQVEILDRCCPPTANINFNEKVQSVNGHNRNIACWMPKTEVKEGVEVESNPTTVRAVVLISHGMLEHALCYYALAIALAEAGYAVYCMDHVGHGLSDGPRGLIPDRKMLVDDFVAFSQLVLNIHPTVPAFVVAHSMGTLVALGAINKMSGIHSLVLSGVAFIPGPASSSPFGMSCLYPLSQTSLAASLAAVTATLAPSGLLAPLVQSAVMLDAEELKSREKDPRRCKPIILNRTGYEVLKLSEEAKTLLPSITLPVLIMHGEDDQVTLPKGSQMVYQNLGTDITQRRLEVFPGMKHELFQETQEDRATKCIAMVVDNLDVHMRVINS